MKFKDYEITYCGWCESPVITCKHCKHVSCSPATCNKCHEDFEEFAKFEKDNELILEKIFENERKIAILEKAELKKKQIEIVNYLQ